MRHVFEADHLKSDKAFIFGKGPSFNRKAAIPEGCKIYCINQTAEFFSFRPFDLAVFNDLEPLVDVLYRTMDHPAAHYAFPFSIHRNEKPTDGHGSSIYYMLNYLEFCPWMFDLNTHKKQGFIEHHPIKAVTTYNTALAIALHHGAKTVYTNGIDGGQGRHPEFKDTHQTYAPNYDAQFELEKAILEKYNAKVVRVQ